MNNKQTALYRHYSKDGSLLYVGISLSAINRLNQHKTCSNWTVDAIRMETEWYVDRKSAIGAERLAVITEKPKFNITYSDINKPKPKRKTNDIVMNPGGIGMRRGFTVYHNNPSIFKCKKMTKLELYKIQTALTKTGQHIFKIVWDQIQNNKDRDEVMLKPMMDCVLHQKLSERVFQKGVRELLEKKFIFMGPIDGLYYINMSIFFNGSRIIAATEYIRSSSINHKDNQSAIGIIIDENR